MRGRQLPWFAGSILLALVLTAAFANVLAPRSPTDGDITTKLIPPVWMERARGSIRSGPTASGATC